MAELDLNLCRRFCKSRLLIVVPPFANIVMPSLAAHILQDTLHRADIPAQIFYSNLLAARIVGFDVYHALADSNRGLVCERLGAIVLGLGGHPNVQPPTTQSLEELERDISIVIRDSGMACADWSFDRLLSGLKEFSSAIRRLFEEAETELVAFTSTFQTITSLELVAASIKDAARVAPHIVVGGSNAEGPMGNGLMTFFQSVDHVFSGELHPKFIDYCKSPERWTRGSTNYSGLRPPLQARLNFDDFFDQCVLLEHPRMAQIWLPIETSRGCWFGEKSHCTFCGLNGGGIQYRSKSAEASLDEYRHYKSKYSPQGFFAVDNIIPRNFFEQFLQPLALEDKKPDLFYEVKANLTFDQIGMLKAAGASSFQPGIEALCTPLLKHMRKGTSALVNLRTLFWAKQLGIRPAWNLLARFPDDKTEWYWETLRLMPAIRHLQPPQAISAVSIDRFSPLFEKSRDYGLRNVRANRLYDKIFAGGTRKADLAYHFEADFDHGYNSDVESAIEHEIECWKSAWKSHRPSLEAFAIGEREVLLVDTRSLTGSSVLLVDRFGHFLKCVKEGWDVVEDAGKDWLIRHNLVLSIEKRIVNLVERLHSPGMTEFLPFTIDRIRQDERDAAAAVSSRRSDSSGVVHTARIS